MIRLSAATGLVTALMALMALTLFTVPAARAGDVREFAGQALYHALGAMIVEGATNDDDVPYYLKQDDRSLFEDDDIDITTSIPSESYAASDAIINQGFSPAEGVTCFPKQQLCFKKSGQIDMKWTDRTYAN